MESKRKFTSKDLILAILTIIILLAVTLVLIKPMDRINQQKDSSRRTDVTAIAKAISLYEADNSKLPSLTGGKQITSTDSNASDLTDITPTYLNFIPRDPDGSDYKLELSSNNSVIVKAKLSNGEGFTANSDSID